MSPAERERAASGAALPDDSHPVHASARTLLRSTALAAVIAAVVLTTVVLPREYGFDPTRIGRVFGFTQQGLAKLALAREESAEASALDDDAGESGASDAAATPGAAADRVSPPADSSGAEATHETTISLQPGEGKELKLVMRRGARARYSWVSNGGGVNFLTHGDTANAQGTYHTYGRGSAVRSDSGVIEAAFDGDHGWFWRNRSAQSVVVTLRTTGEYTELKKPDR